MKNMSSKFAALLLSFAMVFSGSASVYADVGDLTGDFGFGSGESTSDETLGASDTLGRSGLLRANFVINNESQLNSLFPDSNLRAAVFKAVKGSSGADLKAALASFKGSIKASNKGIKKADGLQYLTGADSIDLSKNLIEEWAFLGTNEQEYYGVDINDPAVGDREAGLNVYWNISANPYKTLPSSFGGRLVIKQPASTSADYPEDKEPKTFVRAQSSQKQFSGTLDIGRCVIVDNNGGADRPVKIISVAPNAHGGEAPPKALKVDSFNDTTLNFSGLDRSTKTWFAVGVDQELHYETADEFGTVTPGSQSFKYYIPYTFKVYDKLTIKQNSLAGRFNFTKYGPDGVVKLAGAEYDLYKGDKATGEMLGSFVTGADGSFSKGGLAMGHYTLYETKAPDGYKLSPAPVAFEILEDSNGGATGPNIKIGGGESSVTDENGTTFTANDGELFFSSSPDADPITLTMEGSIPVDVDGDVSIAYSSIDGGSGRTDNFPNADGSLKKAEDSLNEAIKSGKVTGPVAIEIVYHDAKAAKVEVSQRDEALPLINISGRKIWEDNNNENGVRPTSITVKLLRNGSEYFSQVLNEQNAWTYSFTGLSYSDHNGIPYSYTVQEQEVKGYTSTYSGSDIINTLKTTSLSGKKIWDDNNNADGKRPASITVDLLRDGTPIKTQTVSEATGWGYSFNNLPTITQDGKPCSYIVQEEHSDATKNYETSYSGGDITNKLSENPTVTLSGKKIWEDNDNAKNTRPAKITVVLLQNGAQYKSKLVSGPSWVYTFEKLPKTDDNGARYVYTVQEEEVEGYTSSVSGLDITNTLVGSETVSYSGQKIWDDRNNAYFSRPSSVTINLLQNGTVINSKTTDAASDWKYSFLSLPKTDSNGKNYSYSIAEQPVNGYTPSYSGFNVTNTYNQPPTPPRPTSPPSSDDPDEPLFPNPTPRSPEPRTPPVPSPGQPGKPEIPVVPNIVHEHNPGDPPPTGTVDVPPGGEVVVEQPPEHGTVTVTEDGHWEYKPNDGESGTDSFVLKITHNGKTEYILIEVNLLSANKVNPGTGANDTFAAFSLAMLSLGALTVLTLKRRKR